MRQEEYAQNQSAKFKHHQAGQNFQPEVAVIILIDSQPKRNLTNFAFSLNVLQSRCLGNNDLLHIWESLMGMVLMLLLLTSLKAS